MSPVDFSAARKNAEREGQIQGGDYFRFKEGKNVVRLLTNPLPHPGSYKGQRTFKWICYVLDREAGDIKVFFMPHTVHKQLEALQNTDDYAFDDVPMPYDINITANGAGTKEVKYTVIPARKNTPLSASEETLLAQKKPIAEVQDALFQKAEGNGESHESQRFDPDEIPF